jgi:mRNA interferase MazF
MVLSPKLYNEKTGLAVVVPITNQAKGYTFEVPLPPQMKTTGVVLADAVKNVDWRARNAKYADTSPLEVLKAVQERLMLLLGLSEP